MIVAVAPMVAVDFMAQFPFALMIPQPLQTGEAVIIGLAAGLAGLAKSRIIAAGIILDPANCLSAQSRRARMAFRKAALLETQLYNEPVNFVQLADQLSRVFGHLSSHGNFLSKWIQVQRKQDGPAHPDTPPARG